MMDVYPNSANSLLNKHNTEPAPDNSGTVTVRLLMLIFIFSFSSCALMAALQAQMSNGTPHGKSFRMTCNRCHSAGNFIPIRSDRDFDHGTTGFPLRGMHAGIDCRSCHSSLVFTEIGTQCADCHADIHRRQLGAGCDDCHTIRGWDNVLRNSIEHTDRFPLMGAHAAIECESCHQSAATGLFRGLRTDCDFCHHRDYLDADSINHQAAGYSLECEDCHSMDGWLSLFDHGGFTGFALNGAHALLECNDCHSDFIFQGTPADCYACHTEEYNNTVDPNHTESGFSHDCAQCHTTSRWDGAGFIHEGFPIYSGRHATVWTACSDCHTNPADYNVFTCTSTCHVKADMDARHREVRDYVFNDYSCYTCHTNGVHD